MKKTLLALAVMAAAGSAQAGIDVYNNEGVTVNLKGDIEITYQNSTSSSSMSQQIEDADFGFDVRYAINEQLSIGAYWEFNGSDANNSTITKNGDNYIALFTADFGSIKFGRLCTAIDDIGVGNDYQFGVNSFFSSDTFECQDEAVRYDYDNGMFYATLGYVQNKTSYVYKTDGSELDGKLVDSGTQGADGDYIDGYLGARFMEFDVKAIVADYDDDKANGVSNTLFGLEAAYGGIENLNLSVGYYTVDRDNGGVDEDNDTWALAADYTMGKWNFGAGYSDSDADVADSDVSRWFVNTGYAVAPSTTAYIEIAGVDSDKTLANDNLAAIGIKAAF